MFHTTYALSPALPAISGWSSAPVGELRDPAIVEIDIETGRELRWSYIVPQDDAPASLDEARQDSNRILEQWRYETGDLGRVSYLTDATHLHVFVPVMPSGPADDRPAAKDVRAAMEWCGQLVQGVRYAGFDLDIGREEERAYLAVLREHGHPCPIFSIHWSHLLDRTTARPDPAAYSAYGIAIEATDDEEQHIAIRFALACDRAGIDRNLARRGAACIAQTIFHFQSMGYVK